MRGRPHILIPLLILAAALILRVVDPAPVQQLRLLVFDTYQKAKPRTYDVTKSPVRIIDVDDENTGFDESPNPVETLRTRYETWKAGGGLAELGLGQRR